MPESVSGVIGRVQLEDECVPEDFAKEEVLASVRVTREVIGQQNRPVEISSYIRR